MRLASKSVATFKSLCLLSQECDATPTPLDYVEVGGGGSEAGSDWFDCAAGRALKGVEAGATTEKRRFAKDALS